MGDRSDIQKPIYSCETVIRNIKIGRQILLLILTKGSDGELYLDENLLKPCFWWKINALLYWINDFS